MFICLQIKVVYDFHRREVVRFYIDESVAKPFYILCFVFIHSWYLSSELADISIQSKRRGKVDNQCMRLLGFDTYVSQPMLGLCWSSWASVENARPSINQHWVNVLCLMKNHYLVCVYCVAIFLLSITILPQDVVCADFVFDWLLSTCYLISLMVKSVQYVNRK